MWRWIWIIFISTLVHSNHIDRYLSFIKSYYLGAPGSHIDGEIQIVLDPQQIAEIEQLARARLSEKGHSPEEVLEFSQVGIIAEDQYWIWVRDAVIFPSGFKGTYNRILWRSHLDGPPAAVIIPIFADGRIAVIVNYRHATRSWQLQLPAGLRKPGETPEVAARRELKEETGCDAKSLEYLGSLAPDSGVSSSLVPVYLAHIEMTQLPQSGQSEAIEKMLLLTAKELREAVSAGEISVTINGQTKKIPCNDATLAYALQYLN
ncbi:MAG: NUDIX hydrolase [Chlamydiia bacterium]|nr:NUDIX hydrolase [Chlamydiia bacterium]